MKSSRQPANLFVGIWRISWMAGWDQDFVDAEGPAHIVFCDNNLGNLQFGLLHADIDARTTEERIEFTWAGGAEFDAMSGRGHATLIDGELHGHLYIHLGDDSAFRAHKQTALVEPRLRRKKV